MSPDGKEITAHDQPGELVLRSPSIALGYLGNEAATKKTFEDGWLRTGDIAMIRLGSKNTEHVFIVDRIKEIIKVKVGCTGIYRGNFVAPEKYSAFGLG
jgi:long-subunit acyl-CoA synthetase (AMP-forming)